MRIIFTFLLLLLLTDHLSAQEVRTISGRLVSTEDGTPLPGVNVTVKGTQKGTVTDADGRYSITAPVGSVLVFSFVGMRTQEILVSGKGMKTAPAAKTSRTKKKNAKRSTVPSFFLKDSISENTPGVAVLTDNTPTYSNTHIDGASILGIRRTARGYRIKVDDDPFIRTGFGLQFSTGVSIDRANKLPALQSQYAQGRTDGTSIHWNGADNGEIFSWGPLLRTLEFDGSNYAFDRNGKLTTAGTGNGKPARSYDSRSFFRTGFTSTNELMFTAPAWRRGTFIFNADTKTRSGIIPNSDYNKINLSTTLNGFRIRKDLWLSASASYNKSHGNLLGHGGNLASIIGAVFRTPASFDNANGFSKKQSWSTPESYQLQNGSVRAHAPGLADNPIGLINTLPDAESLERFIGTAMLRYTPENNFEVEVKSNIDRQESTNIFGISNGYSGYPDGRLTKRHEIQTFGHLLILPQLYHSSTLDDFRVKASYQLQYTNRELNRTDAFGFVGGSFGETASADSVVTTGRTLSRTSHEIGVNVEYSHPDWLKVKLGGRSYFSNTVNSSLYTNFFPSIDVSIVTGGNLAYDLQGIKLYGSLSTSLREAPLLYSNWSYGSTRSPVSAYNSFFESTEIFYSPGLAPETERKFETGVSYERYHFNIEASYFNNYTNDFIAPIWNEDRFGMQNVASIKNTGGSVSLGLFGYMDKGNWRTDLRWSKYNSVADELYGSKEFLPLAGFETVQSVIAPGQPVGAIYGTSYKKDSEGKIIIGDDGFPLEDQDLRMIGNPIPDWTLNWSASAGLRRFRLSFLLEFKRGGEVWNGTRAMLDYLGRTPSTADLRTLSQYVFDGVNENGDLNAIPVSFYDPSKPVNENRWTRYGWDGVGEEYIEDASWIRMNELSLSYSCYRRGSTGLKEIKITLTGRNLFIITPYSGVDPSTSLFGYSTGGGMDLFNTPATRSYTAQLTIKI